MLSFPTYEKLNEQDYQCLLGYLNQLSSMKEEETAEIVKFLQAILDKLIDILLDLNNKTENFDENIIEFHKKYIQPRVFEILVFIFQIIENQSKYASFRSVIDAYLEKNFCITLVHKPILRLFNQLLNAINEKYNIIDYRNDKISIQNYKINIENLSNQQSFDSDTSLNTKILDEKEELTLNTIKSIEFVFKFAFRSRELLTVYNKSNHQNTKEEIFDKDIENIFRQMVRITKLNSSKTTDKVMIDEIKNKTKKIKITQLLILNNVINLIPILIKSKRYSIESVR